jgi:hypothetical protein
MAHTFNVSSLVSKQFVQSLHAKGNLINIADKSRSQDFTQKKYTPGQTVTIEVLPQASITSGRVASLQDQKPKTLTVTLAQYNGAFDMTSIQKEYDTNSEKDMRRFGDTIAMRLAREMEVTGFSTASQYVGNAVGNPGTEPGSLRTWATARSRITDALGPMRDCYAAASPLAHVAITDSLKNATNPGAVISNQYLSGRMKNAAGMNFFESNSTWRHTAGTADNTTPLVDGAPTNGSTTLHIDGTTNGDIVNVGTKFTVGAVGAADAVYAVDPETGNSLPYLQKFSVISTSAASSGSGDVDLTVSPAMYDSTDSRQNLSQLPPDGAEITFDTEDEQLAQQNLVFDKDALTLVSVPLGKDSSGGLNETFANYEGIQIRTAIHPRDGINDSEILRVDACWGWAVPRPEHACIVWGA